MSYTYEELTQRMLYHLDVYEILELLDVTPEELIDRFEDKVTKDYDKIEGYISGQ
jgi:hypothetical protein